MADKTQVIEICTRKNLLPMVRVAYTLEIYKNQLKHENTDKKKFKRNILTSRTETINENAKFDIGLDFDRGCEFLQGTYNGQQCRIQ